MLLMPTGCSLIPSTQAPSHGAGQTRPVNSGKLFAIRRRHVTVLEHEIVPLGDDVRDRATGVGLTERHTTVHAARELVFQLVLRQTVRNLLPVLNPLARRAVGLCKTLVLHEATGLVELAKAALSGGLGR